MALKCGFIRVIFFPASVVKVEKHNRKLLCHLPRVIDQKLVNVVGIGGHLVAHALKAENASNEENDLRDRRENVPQEASDRLRVAREPRECPVRRGSVPLARQESGPLDPGELKALPRKLQ